MTKKVYNPNGTIQGIFLSPFGDNGAFVVNSTFIKAVANSTVGVHISASEFSLQNTLTVSNLVVTESLHTNNLILDNTVFGNTTVTGFINISSTANIAGNVNIAGLLTTNQNIKLNTSSLISSFSVNTNGTSLQTIDSFLLSEYRGGQYTILISDTSVGANAYQINQLLILQNNSDSLITEYGIITSNNSIGYLGTISATANSTHSILKITPYVSNTTIKISRTLLTI